MSETETTSLQKPGETIKPDVTAKDAKKLVLNVFGFKVTTIKELVSYDDKNFYVEFDGTSENPQLSTPPDACVFKVINRLDSKNRGIIEAQTQILLHLHGKGFSVPYPVLNKNGQYTQEEHITSVDKDGSSTTCMNVVRMLAYIPGKILFQVPYTANLLYECGQYVADIVKALQSFHHPALVTRTFSWQMTRIPQLTEFLFIIKDEDKKRLCERVIEEFEAKVTAQYDKLRMGSMHGDLNEQNILVRLKSGSDDEYEVAGVIDVGDIQFSYYIFEIAMTVMYCMLEAVSLDKLEAGGHVLAGFLSKQSLTDSEFQVLKVCMEGRLVQSLVMGAYGHSMDPSNDYVMTTAKNGWKVLSRLITTSEEELFKMWDKIMKSRGLHIPNFPFTTLK